eukprot:m.357433 g.357433  ORF g.357433 m.357433 type:complete len:287 (-) comp55974_c0_seq6:80-940(-)
MFVLVCLVLFWFASSWSLFWCLLMNLLFLYVFLSCLVYAVWFLFRHAANASLTTLDSLFRGLTKLEFLWVHNNPRVGSIHTAVFADNSFLLYLHIGGLLMTELRSDLFNSLTRIERLWIENNPIETLPADLFLFNPTIQRLYLTNTHISTLRADMFKGLKDIKELYLGANPIREIGSRAFAGLSQKCQVDLCGMSDRVFAVASDAFEGTTLKSIGCSGAGLEACNARYKATACREQCGNHSVCTGSLTDTSFECSCQPGYSRQDNACVLQAGLKQLYEFRGFTHTH